MEYRGFVTIPDLPFEREEVWEPFIEHLERELADYGPVLAWHDGATQIIVATDAADEATAAGELCAAVARGMLTGGLPGYPFAIEIERVKDPAQAAV